VLVVDDHNEMAENLAEILSGVGFEACVATSAEDALVQVERRAFGALVTDIRLPGLSGVDLLRALAERGVNVPAVVMSAHTDAGTVEDATQAGAARFLPKPIDIQSLLTELELLAGPAAAPRA